MTDNSMTKEPIEINRTYDSDVLEEFLSLGTPEEQARVDNRMMLAAKIYDAIQAKGIGKKQFAELIGQKPSVITKWLSGGHNFTVDTLTDIQRVLDVRLLALDEPMPQQHVYRFVAITTVQIVENQWCIDESQSYSLPNIPIGKAKTTPQHFHRELKFA